VTELPGSPNSRAHTPDPRGVFAVLPAPCGDWGLRGWSETPKPLQRRGSQILTMVALAGALASQSLGAP
jgi:hypothetical protein